jgi:hypothetical protein
MAEEIEDPRFGTRDCGKGACPYTRCVIAAHGLAIFITFDQLEANRANLRTEIKRFDIQQVH